MVDTRKIQKEKSGHNQFPVFLEFEIETLQLERTSPSLIVVFIKVRSSKLDDDEVDVDILWHYPVQSSAFLSY